MQSKEEIYQALFKIIRDDFEIDAEDISLEANLSMPVHPVKNMHTHAGVSPILQFVIQGKKTLQCAACDHG